ncbi:MAG: arylsulfatase [Prolixibacteraceae bacterium]
MKIHFRSFSTACITAFAMTGFAQKPNILIILADDLGYSDIGCYGSEIKTPNLDRLAKNGVRFTQFYNSARCCPSRASLLTGLFPHQAGIGAFVGAPLGEHGYTGSLTSNAVTLAEVLKTAGYSTYGSGKWHVNFPGPTDRGFDEYYGFLTDYGIDGWRSKWMKRYPEGRTERKYPPGEFFATNAITDYALDFLKMSEPASGKPWFLYLAYQAVHFPLQAPAKDIEKYKETYQVGWDVIRSERLARMKKIGVVPKNTKLSERSDIPQPKLAKRNGVPGDGIHNPPWDILDKDRQTDLARRMAVYAAMLDNMDQNVGRVLDYLKKTGQLNNTMILFMSDNGSCAEWEPFGFEFPTPDARVNGGTGAFPNVLHKGESLEKLGSPEGPLFSYGSGWANVGNTPFTLYKHFVHEGGISSPLIIHWPDKIRKSQIITKQYAHFVDVMATCVEVSGAAYPLTFKGNAITPMEGTSLFKTLKSKSDPTRILPFEHSGHAGIRVGDWKLVSRQMALERNSLAENSVFELYNIKEDRSETRDLSLEHPEKVKELKELMMKEFKRTNVLPRPKIAE